MRLYDVDLRRTGSPLRNRFATIQEAKEHLKSLIASDPAWAEQLGFHVSGAEFRQNFNRVFACQLPNQRLDLAFLAMIEVVETAIAERGK